MKKIYLLIATTISAGLAFAQFDLISEANQSRNPQVFQQPPVDSCRYYQLGNNFENGYASETGTSGSRAAADDIVVPANQCVTIYNITWSHLVNNPTSVDITIMDDANNDPGTTLNSIINPAFTTNLLGTAFSYNVYELSVDLATPITLCAGTVDTHFWLSCQAEDGSGGSTYWEFRSDTFSNYRGRYSGSGLGGPWDSTTYNLEFVFSLDYSPTVVMEHTGCESVVFQGNTYFSDTVVVDSFITASGCDSVVQNNIIVENAQVTTLNYNGCDSLMVDSVMYYASTSFSETLTSANGCDSVVETNITITGTSTIATINYFSGCDSAMYMGTMYDSSFAIYDTLAGSSCDSIVVDSVVIYASTNRTKNVTIAEGESYSVGGNTYTTSGTYVNNLTSIHGCDSVITTKLTVQAPTNGLKEIAENVSVFPNPTENLLTIQSEDIIMESIRIIDVTGSVVINESINSNNASLNLHALKSGLYFFEITDENGEIMRDKLIKK